MSHREKCARGSALPQSKLTEEQTVEIRALHYAKTQLIAELNAQFSAKGLAERYGVHHRTIEKVLQRDTWPHTLKKCR